MPLKKITIFVDPNIEVIREHLLETTGVKFTYVQLFNYLINYYRKGSSIPATKWKKD